MELKSNQQPRQRGGFTVCELLVVLIGIGVLLALLLPAVIHARESARRASCTSQLREVGVAIHGFHSRHGRLPRAWRPLPTEPQFVWGWATELLPDLGEPSIQQQLQKVRGITEIEPLAAASLPVLLCPSDISRGQFQLRAESGQLWAERQLTARGEFSSADRPTRGDSQWLPTANYVGVFGTFEADDLDELSETGPPPVADGAIVHDQTIRFADLRRGLSRTIIVGERTMATVPSTWLGVHLAGEDATCRLVGSAITHPNCAECDECEFSSRHTGGSNFLWADGHVEHISDDVDTTAYRQHAMRLAKKGMIAHAQ
ncbi:MAG: DUF1559 domain-containing protein [Planctomycetales bacterium]|nr:DUF1559 domain-containing protein [Planctomycetales bacterium]